MIENIEVAITREGLFDLGRVTLEQVEEEDHRMLLLSTPVQGGGGGRARHSLPFGRQHELWREFPSLQRKLGVGSDPSRHVKVACVAIVVDAAGSVLLTRRPRVMRSFPLAWVLPGGCVEEGEGLKQAVEREVFEECGLSVTIAGENPIACWESAFPLAIHELEAAGGILKGHCFMVGFEAKVSEVQPILDLSQQDFQEVDHACWVPKEYLKSIVGETAVSETLHNLPIAKFRGGSESVLSGSLISPEQLAGAYPNDRGEGMGLGHLFILRRWLETS